MQNDRIEFQRPGTNLRRCLEPGQPWRKFDDLTTGFRGRMTEPFWKWMIPAALKSGWSDAPKERTAHTFQSIAKQLGCVPRFGTPCSSHAGSVAAAPQGEQRMGIPRSSVFQSPQGAALDHDYRSNQDLLSTPACSHSGTNPRRAQTCRLPGLSGHDEGRGRTLCRPGAAASLQIPLPRAARSGSLLDALLVRSRSACCFRPSAAPLLGRW